MRAVITGCGGFIGSHLAERCLADGWDVLGIDCFNDNYGRKQKLSNLSRAREWDAFEFVPVDMANGRLGDLVAEADVILHLAAEPGVRSSWGRRFEIYVRNNVIATQHLLNAVVEREPMPRVVYASSSSIYGSQSEPVSEDATPAPFSPYGITKLTAEHLVHAYHENFGVEAVSLRYFSVYGPRQRPDMGFHIFCRAALRGEPIRVLGDGLQSRDFTYVDDVTAATMEAAIRPGIAGSIFNIGAGHQVTVLEAIALIEQIAERKLEVQYRDAELGDVRHTAADASAAHERLGWQPRQDFSEGLRREFEWLASVDDAAVAKS